MRGCDRAGRPGGIGGCERRAFEQGGGFGEGVGEEAELGGEEGGGGGGGCWRREGRLWLGEGLGAGAGVGGRGLVVGWVGVGESDMEEVDGVGEEGVDCCQRCEMDWVVGVDGEDLWREGAEAEVDCLERGLLLAVVLALAENRDEPPLLSVSLHV